MSQKKKKSLNTSTQKDSVLQRKVSDSKGKSAKLSLGENNNSFIAAASVILIVAVFFFVYPYTFDLKVDLNGDNLNYYYLAKNVSERGKFSYFYDSLQAAHSHFPPGYPWIMSIFMKISDSVYLMKVLNGGFLLGSCLLIFNLLRNLGASIAISLTTVLAIILNANFLRYGTIMMSEIPFIFFSMLCLYFFSKVDFSLPIYKNFNLIAGTLAMIYACHIRTQGIAILPGILLFLLFCRKYWHLAAVLGIFVVGMFPWQLRNKINNVKSDYVESLLQVNPYRPELGKANLSQFVERIIDNLHRYIDKEVPSAIFSNLQIDYKYEEGFYVSNWSYFWVGLILITLMLFGIFSIKKNKELILGYIIGTSGIILIWPSIWFGFRFILPIIPVLIFGVVNGVKFILDKLLSSIKAPVSFNAILLVPVFLLLNIKGIEQYNLMAKGNYDVRYQRYFETAKWAKENLPEDSYIACRKIELFYHFSGLRPTQFLKSNDKIAVLESLKTSGITHVVLEQLGYADTQRYLYPVITTYPQYFNVVYETSEPKTYLLEFNKDLPLPEAPSKTQ